MTPFDPSAYGPTFARLAARRAPQSARPRPTRRGTAAVAGRAGGRRRLPARRVVDRAMADACRAGMWLLFDFLDESHTISQELHTAEGSYWHAIMHRREQDASNSKYWFRKVGNHPVLRRLVEQVPALGYNYANPFEFVDFCGASATPACPTKTWRRGFSNSNGGCCSTIAAGRRFHRLRVRRAAGFIPAVRTAGINPAACPRQSFEAAL